MISRKEVAARLREAGEDNNAGTHEDTAACHCHECDEVFRYDRGIIPNYCPSCGARVVRDED